jgi:hypothetical protein
MRDSNNSDFVMAEGFLDPLPGTNRTRNYPAHLSRTGEFVANIPVDVIHTTNEAANLIEGASGFIVREAVVLDDLITTETDGQMSVVATPVDGADDPFRDAGSLELYVHQPGKIVPEAVASLLTPPTIVTVGEQTASKFMLHLEQG